MAEYDFIAITASAGGIPALAEVLSALPTDFDVPIVVVQHHAPGRTPNLAQVLSRLSRRPVRIAEEGQHIKRHTVYVAPGAAHFVVRPDHAIVLTGLGRNGAEGVRRVKQLGGTVIAQDEATSLYFSMPNAASATGAVDSVLPLGAIAPALIHLTAKAA